jgi:hypothetical protein
VRTPSPIEQDRIVARGDRDDRNGVGHGRLFRREAAARTDDRFAAVPALHVQLRISGMSSPYLAMYCLCSMSFSRIACCT